jgi:adenine/guanine phosphoribosyltransferase-like PRPP-binding protein
MRIVRSLYRYRKIGIDKIGGFDARGFILGPPVALALNIPFFMLRKKGKLPNAVAGSSYSKVRSAHSLGIFLSRGSW